MGAWAEQLIASRSSGANPFSSECLRELNGIVEQAKAKSGWSTTADITRSQLTMYSEKTVAWALSGNDIDFSTLREVRTSIYFCVSSEAVKKFGPLMNLFFTQAIQQNSKILPIHGGHCADGSLRLKYQVLFVMDEIAVMGRVEAMETGPALTRGAGLRYFIIFQSKDQLRSDQTYGRETGDAIMKAFHIEIAFAPGDIDVAEAYSKRLGNTTVRVRNDSVNHGKQKSRTSSYTDQARALMLPQEVNEIPYGEELIFVQGTQQSAPVNIKARKIVYYQEDVFKSRENMTPPILPVGDASLVDALTVPMRVNLPTAAMVAPHDLPIQQEQQKRASATQPSN
ncbi:type IV secretory system conjugative DNA transfer family protein [Serratia proteamaculans]|uniref:type IV secretory system conjugative DNA transfer family protein n=1 Tax=Serratia proteamaculans TaxID=28151 RepID=UPI003CFE8C74